MHKKIDCSDIVVGCAVTVHGQSEDEVLKAIAEHARAAHGVREVTPELLAKVKAAVRNG